MHLLTKVGFRYTAALRQATGNGLSSLRSQNILRRQCHFRRLSTSPAVNIGSELSSAPASSVASGGVDLVAAGLGGYTPAGVVQEYVTWIHTSLGLPWWATAAMLAMSVRIALVPFQVPATSAGSHYALLADEIYKRVTVYDTAITYDQAKSAAKDIRDLEGPARLSKFSWWALYWGVAASAHCTSLYALYMLSKAPEMANVFSHGGVVWAPSLAVPDPLFILPAVCLLLSCVGNRTVAEKGMGSVQHRFNAVVYALSLQILLAFQGTSLMQLYWLGNVAIHLVVAAVLQVRPIAQALDIPDITPILKEQTFQPLLGSILSPNQLPPVEELRTIAAAKREGAIAHEMMLPSGRQLSFKPVKVSFNLSSSRRCFRTFLPRQPVTVRMGRRNTL